MKKTCPCGAGNQHTLSQAGRCDAMRKGKLGEWSLKTGKQLPPVKTVQAAAAAHR